MTDKRQVLLGLYPDDSQAAAAVEALRDTEFELERVYSPIPSHLLEAALELPKSKVGWFTLVGAIIGFFSGFWLAAFTSTRWDLIVGGKPVLAWIPFVIVGFEFTILFAVFGNVVGLITQARLPRLVHQGPYEPRLTHDRFGLVVGCPKKKVSDLIRFFKETGAEVASGEDREAVHP